MFNDGIYDDMVTVVEDLLVTSNESEIINLVATFAEAGRKENKFRRSSARVIKKLRSRSSSADGHDRWKVVCNS